MNYSGPWLAAAAVVVTAVLAVPSHGGADKDSSSRSPSDRKNYINRSPSDRVVWYKLDGRDVHYYILADGRVYPGTVRDDKYIIWHRAEPLLVSEYPYGGPQCRQKLIEAGKIDYQTELPPKELKRITTPKEKQ